MKPQYIIFAYVTVTAGIGILLAGRNKTVSELLVAKKGLGVLLLVPLVMSETIGGSATVGNTAEAMEIGMAAVWSTWGLAIGCVAFALVFSQFYRVLGSTRGVLSVPNAYEIMFDRRTKILMLLIVCVVYSILFALQPVSAAAILAPMLGVHRNVIIAITGAVFIIVAVKGGLKGLACMNIVHCFVMFFGLLAVMLLAVRQNGGMQAIVNQLPAGAFSLWQPSAFTAVSWALGTVFAQMSSALMVNICLGAKTLRMARIGITAGSAIIMVFGIFPPVLGIIATLAIPDADAGTALYALADSIGPWIGGIASMAVIAAIFSTAPALLLVVSGTLTQDFYKGVFRPNATEKQMVRFAKWSTVLVGAVAVLLGSTTRSIFTSTVGAFQIRSIAGVVLAVALVWPRVSAAAGFWSILTGGGLAAIWHFAGNPWGIAPLLPSMLLGLSVLVVVTLRSRERVSPGYNMYQQLKQKYKEKEAPEPQADSGKLARLGDKRSV